MLINPEDNLDNLLTDLESHISENNTVSALNLLKTLQNSFKKHNVLRFKEGNHLYAIPVSSIKYIKSDNGLLFISCNHKRFVVDTSLKSLLNTQDDLILIKRGFAATKESMTSLYFVNELKRWFVEVRGLEDPVSVSRSSIVKIKRVFEK